MEAGPYRALEFEHLGSTNDEAMARLRAGDPGGLFIVARQQSEGRGRHGRSWSSPSGNLYASLALVDPAPQSIAPQLGFVVGVALAQTLRARLRGDPRLQLKWPNDVVFAGAKLAGLLIEGATLSEGRLGCVVGIGVNCVSHPSGLATTASPATDLALAGDPEPDPRRLLAELARRIDINIRIWSGGSGFAAIRRDWLDVAAGLGREIEVRTPQRALRGTFRDIDPQGRLRLDGNAGTTHIEAGDVFLLHPAC